MTRHPAKTLSALFVPALLATALFVAGPAAAQPTLPPGSAVVLPSGSAATLPAGPATPPAGHSGTVASPSLVASAVTPLLVLPNNPTRAVALALIDGKPYVCHLADTTNERAGGTCVAMTTK
jgi:hypothetical protein